MPIVADPTAPPPSPPSSIWSADGLVRLVEDPAWSAVWIVADFATVNLVGNPGGEDDTAGWTPPTGTTVTRDTTNPISGSASLRFDVASTTGDSMPQYDVTPKGGVGAKVTALCTVRNESGATRDFQVRVFELSDFASRDFTAVTLGPGESATVRVKHARTASGSTRITPGMKSVSAGDAWTVDNVMIVDGDYDGPFRLPSYPAVKRVRVIRTNPDGTDVIVRGADPAWAPGGMGVAYDFEAPLSAAVSYRVEGLGWAGDTVLATSQAAAISTTEPAQVWLKSVDDPGLSMQVRVEGWEETDGDSRTDASTVMGRALRVPVFGTPGGISGRLTVSAFDKATYDALRTLLRSGTLLMQAPQSYGIPADLYVFRVGELPIDRPDMMPSWVYRRFVIQLEQQDPPPTLGQPSRVPGHSYADRLADHPTYADVPQRTYLEGLLS